ncbi:MAG: hypothetical protein CMO26_23475 [Thiotrichales bacterium]|nr:hypothetical protein [Thiotrichales bacterium]|tara:strand:+ start:696 stop:896 length:201 start_codon:yes stop_codon:yes gene_type:complete
MMSVKKALKGLALSSAVVLFAPLGVSADSEQPVVEDAQKRLALSVVAQVQTSNRTVATALLRNPVH